MKKQFLRSMFLACMLVIMLLPTMASAEGEPIKYNLWVAGQQVTSTNKDDVFGDGKVWFTPAEGDNPATLTLDNFSYTGTGYEYDTQRYAAIYTLDRLNIVLKGVNTITATGDSGNYYSGIMLKNQDLTISDDDTGSLTVSGKYYGIYAKGNVTISGSTVNATSTGTAISSSDNITIENNTQVTATGSYGIDASGNVKISGSSTVTTRGASTGIDASGYVEISGSSTVTTMDARTGINASGNVTISGSSTVTATSTATGSNAVYGFYSKTVAISGNSEVTVNATTEGSGNAYGIYAGGGNTDNAAVDISGKSTVTVNATAASNYAYGIYTKSNNTTRGNVKISGNSTVKVTAEGSSYAYGIYTESTANSSQYSNNSNVTISDSTVTVDASAASGSAYGIYTKNNLDVNSGNVEISGNSKVDVTAEGSSNVYGVYTESLTENNSGGNVTISGGQVTVKATAASGQANGINININGQVTISESSKVNVTANGSYANGIKGKNVDISGSSTVTVSATAASNYAYGIYATNGNLTISGGDVNVTAKGSSNVYGVYANGGYSSGTNRGNITISGGDVNVTAKGSSNVYGVYANGGTGSGTNRGKITISNNGAVTASGDSQAMNKAPDVSQVAAGYIITASEDADGSDLDDYNPANYDSYKYIKIGPITYSVTPERATNGSVTVDKTTAAAGELVTITVAPEIGYEVDTVVVYKTSDDTTIVTVTNNGEFTMPAYSVTISVTFKAKSYSITPAAATNGSFTVKVGDGTPTSAATTATKGDTVTITATPDEGYEVDTVAYTPDSGSATAITTEGGVYSFTMPAANVTVSVTFKEIPAPAPTPTPTPTPTPAKPRYPVVEQNSEDSDGTVSFSKSRATRGSTVKVTVTPDKYYGVEKVIVRNASGKEIQTTKNADGTYSFKMPNGKVTVEAVYVWENPFVDVKEDTYYIDAVEWALKNGITEGTSETTFSPVAACTRAQMVTFLWRAAGCPEPGSAVCDFTDVNVDSYYGKAVLWAIENGITNGTGDGSTFSPDMECSRAQMAAFLCRMADGKVESDENAFIDVKADAYYADSVQWAVENGITEGTGEGMYSPDAVCTRGQMVTFLYRYYVNQ